MLPSVDTRTLLLLLLAACSGGEGENGKPVDASLSVEDAAVDAGAGLVDAMTADADVSVDASLCASDGAFVGSACWYMGTNAQNCSSVCITNGLTYSAATRTFSGSDGTTSNCKDVLDALGVPGGAVQEDNGYGGGCTYNAGIDARLRWLSPTTSPLWGDLSNAPACACE